MSVKKDPPQLCSCKCHYGGAISCPECKDSHGIDCCNCKEKCYFFDLDANILRFVSSVFKDSI